MKFSYDSKKKILFVIGSLGPGGAERVAVDLINHLDRNKYDVLLVILKNELDFKKDLDPSINIISLNKKSRWDFFKLVLKLKRIMLNYEPDIVISSLIYTNIVTGLAKILTRRNFTIIFWEHNHPHDSLSRARFGNIKKRLMKIIYKKADRIITVSKEIKRVLVEDFDIYEKRIKTIYNPILLESIRKKTRAKIEHRFFKEKNAKIIISVGRLTLQKRFDRLLRVFSIVRKKCKNCRLIIVGKGKLREELKNLSSKLDIDKYVDFVGFKSNPYAWIKKADIFVMSSDYEGFPVVLLESIACGTPIVSTNCSSGPNEIITNGKNGILVPLGDCERLEKAILALLKNKDLRKKFSKEGVKRAEDFRIEKILPQYEKLFELA